jgi:prolyl-tRNA editing enzyme YbaK/EbsC (Cys-tRNA(Pro) deacylase)
MERAIAVGIAPRIERFPKGTRTSKDAAHAVGCELGAIAKSLVFEVDGRPVLVICSGDRRVDEGKLAAHFSGHKARPASRDRVHDLTGFPAGGTPAVGHDIELDTVADTALDRYRWVWSAGGTLDTVYEVTLDRLIAGSQARWANISTEGPP